MEELLDVLDEKGGRTGKTCTKDEAHGKGLLHRTAHVWFLNSKNQLLLQKRTGEKRTYAGYWDISAAGHLAAGQTSIEAAQRETEEELGISLPHSAFQYLFTVHEHAVLKSGIILPYINDEFQDVYIVRSDVEILNLHFTDKEVADARWIDLKEFEQWVEGRGDPLVPHKEEHAKLLAFIRNHI